MTDRKSVGAAVKLVETFFGTLEAARWDAAAAMVDPGLAATFRNSELASLIAWARHRDAIIAMHQRGEGAVGWSSDGRVDAAIVDQYRATPLHGVPGVQTLADLAAMSPRDFIAKCLEASNGAIMTPDGTRIELRRRVIGGVREGNAIAHVLFRVEGPGVQHTDPLAVEVIRLRAAEAVWHIDPTSLSPGIANIQSLTMLADFTSESASLGVKPGAPDA